MQLFIRSAIKYQIQNPMFYNRQYFSTFQDKLQQRQMQQAADEYKKEIEFLANKPTFTLIDFRQRIVDGLHKMKKGLKSKFATGMEQTEIQLTQQKQILNAMFDDELIDPNNLNGQKRKEIAMVAQVQVQDVNQVLSNFNSMQNLHKWIREKKETGEKLPDNQDELLYRFRQDKPMSKSFLKFELKRPSFSKKQRLQKIKWGNKRNI